MPKDMLEMFFGKTFNRDGLDARTRFLVTISGMVRWRAGRAATQGRDPQCVGGWGNRARNRRDYFQMSMFGGVPP